MGLDLFVISDISDLFLLLLPPHRESGLLPLSCTDFVSFPTLLRILYLSRNL